MKRSLFLILVFVIYANAYADLREEITSADPAIRQKAFQYIKDFEGWPLFSPFSIERGKDVATRMDSILAGKSIFDNEGDFDYPYDVVSMAASTKDLDWTIPKKSNLSTKGLQAIAYRYKTEEKHLEDAFNFHRDDLDALLGGEEFYAMYCLTNGYRRSCYSGVRGPDKIVEDVRERVKCIMTAQDMFIILEWVDDPRRGPEANLWLTKIMQGELAKFILDNAGEVFDDGLVMRFVSNYIYPGVVTAARGFAERYHRTSLMQKIEFKVAGFLKERKSDVSKYTSLFGDGYNCLMSIEEANQIKEYRKDKYFTFQEEHLIGKTMHVYAGYYPFGNLKYEEFVEKWIAEYKVPKECWKMGSDQHDSDVIVMQPKDTTRQADYYIFKRTQDGKKCEYVQMYKGPGAAASALVGTAIVGGFLGKIGKSAFSTISGGSSASQSAQNSDEDTCIYCGRTGYGGSCQYSPTGHCVHRGGAKCKYCGRPGYGGSCQYSPTGHCVH